MASEISDDIHRAASTYHDATPSQEKLQKARAGLLDLSTRNTLLSIPKSKSRKVIDIADGDSQYALEQLVIEKKSLGFIAKKGAVVEVDGSGDDTPVHDGATRNTVNLRRDEEAHSGDGSARSRGLQTRLDRDSMQSRLHSLYLDARTLEEEQGVNVLYLALGALKYVDSKRPDIERFAPLMLVPVSLERSGAGDKFRVRFREEEISTNLSLAAYLRQVHKIHLPEVDEEKLSTVGAYFAQVTESIANKTGWEVRVDHITLGLFSFAKFLMYEDLAPDAWPASAPLLEQPLIKSIMETGFAAAAPLIPQEDYHIDDALASTNKLSVLPCDSSQALAAHAVRQGQHVVIKGPPGTGKSQTITNIIAAAVADGKKVLFVAEKMAALEVVHRRLKEVHLESACLELHSKKSNKRDFLGQLKSAWHLGAPKAPHSPPDDQRLHLLQNILNKHALSLHTPYPPALLTPYEVIGALIQLDANAHVDFDLKLHHPERWTQSDLQQRRHLLADLCRVVDDIGFPPEQPWHGVGLQSILPQETKQWLELIGSLTGILGDMQTNAQLLAQAMVLPTPRRLQDVDDLLKLVERLIAAPELTCAAAGHVAWSSQSALLQQAISAGSEAYAMTDQVMSRILPEALQLHVAAAASTLRAMQGSKDTVFDASAHVTAALPKVLDEIQSLSNMLNLEQPVDLAGVHALMAIAEQVSTAPDIDANAFLGAAWERDTQQASELVDALAALEQAQSTLRGRLTDDAWAMDLTAANQTLKEQAANWLRIFNATWRRDKQLVQSVLVIKGEKNETIFGLLDALHTGKRARDKLVAQDALGRDLFGTAWQGVKSRSADIKPLLDWMLEAGIWRRSARQCAAKQPDRSAVMARLERLKPRIAYLGELLVRLQGVADCSLFQQIFVDVQHAPLAEMSGACHRVCEADAVCQQALTTANLAVTERTVSLNLLSKHQALLQEVKNHDDLARQALAPFWQGPQSDWGKLAQVHPWCEAHADLLPLLSRINDRSALRKLAQSTRQQFDNSQSLLGQLCHGLQVSSRETFAADAPHLVPLVALVTKLNTWRTSGESLSKWVNYVKLRKLAADSEMGGLTTLIERSPIRGEAVKQIFEKNFHEVLFRDMATSLPNLGTFDGASHAHVARDFIGIDQACMQQATYEALKAYRRNVPSQTGGVGEVGILSSEIEKKRSGLPIRQIMRRAGRIVQALKPVFMMSPLSVAQFLPPGEMTFDLLVIDEASQVQPVDALGALARCKQAVVVGDEKQLPPTSFFAKMTSGDEDDTSDEAGAADAESILGLLMSRGMVQHTLNWHYRSRDQSLIAVSNREYYENRLFIPPTPWRPGSDMGLRFRRVHGAIYDAGKTRTNQKEAQKVAEAVMHHARTMPERSLGVATFSVAQRGAILAALEELRKEESRQHPDTNETETFFRRHEAEPFFVKSIENVQGDERDVILISVGYGPDTEGRLALQFGPLSRTGGERRLNVLISRAKYACDIFASFDYTDIDLARSPSKGVAGLQVFMEYACTGQIKGSSEQAAAKLAEAEEHVKLALEALGHQIHAKVGQSGYFIDLAVSDDQWPTRYMLGIEFDSQSYHSGRSARERDRLRNQVLEDHHWILYRIWVLDWYQRPKEEMAKLLAAIDAAKQELISREGKEQRRRALEPVQLTYVDRPEVTEVGIDHQPPPPPPAVERYVEYVPPLPANCPQLHEAPVELLAGLVSQIVAVEGPVHVEEVIGRLRSAWGLQRTGTRILAAADAAIKHAVENRPINREDDFLTSHGVKVKVRDRSEVLSGTLRRPEMIAPIEVREAIFEIVQSNMGATAEQLSTAVARKLGFKSTSMQMKRVVQQEIDNLVASQALVLRGELLNLTSLR